MGYLFTPVAVVVVAVVVAAAVDYVFVILAVLLSAHLLRRFSNEVARRSCIVLVISFFVTAYVLLEIFPIILIRFSTVVVIL